MTTHPSLAAALIAAQQAFEPIHKDNTANTGKFSYTYADLGSVLEAVTPALHANGLVVSQPLDVVDGQPVIRTILMHTDSGERIESNGLIVWADKSDPQKFGGGITYTRRYAIMALLNLNAEDDDGQRARQHAPVRAPQPRSATMPDDAYDDVPPPRGDIVEEQARQRSFSANPPTEKQIGMMNGLLSKVYGTGWEKDDARIEDMRQWLHSITGCTSRTQLTKSTISTYIDWLKDQPAAEA